VSKSQVLSCLGAAAILAGAAGAHAQATDQRVERVSYSDLDLAHSAGQTVLASRIHAAADRVCGSSPDLADLVSLRVYKSCVRFAEAGATSQMRQAIVSAGGGVIRLAQSDRRR
jgi:UrcA family protein